MNGLPYYKAYPRDFIEGTVGMSFELKAAYRLVLDLVYMQGGDLPDNSRYIAGLLGCSVRKWNGFRDELLSLGKLRVSGEFLTNDRAVIELESLRKVQEKLSENRSRPNKNNNLQSQRSHHTEPDTEPEVKEDTNVSSKKRATRLPENWLLPKDWGEWAVCEGWPEEVVRIEAEKFRDYWIGVGGQKGAKRDWQATWRNWMRNSKSPRVLQGGQNGNGNYNTDRVQRIVSAAAGGSSGKDWG